MATEVETRVNIPPIANLQTAIKLYHRPQDFLFNKDIISLFPGIGTARIQQLKRLARAITTERNGIQLNSRSVNTKDAFKAWGLDIDDLEARYAKFKKLGLEDAT